MRLPKFRIWTVAILTALLLFLSTGTGFSQQKISFTSLQIDLWPEYDSPAMLVIYRARLAPNVQFPVNLTFRIPVGAGKPNAVAERSGNLLLEVDYTRVEQGEWGLITFTANQPEIQIEYYDPSIRKNDGKRAYIYNWPGDYDIDGVVMLVQQPTGAENMRISPRLSDVTQDARGLVYYGAEIGSFKANEIFKLTIDYEKDSDSLTVEFLPIESAPIDENTAGRVSLVTIVPWGLGLLGVIIIFAGIYWYWATERKQGKTARKSRKVTVKETDEAISASTNQGAYCAQCGKRASAGDKFCRACGNKLRV